MGFWARLFGGANSAPGGKSETGGTVVPKDGAAKPEGDGAPALEQQEAAAPDAGSSHEADVQAVEQQEASVPPPSPSPEAEPAPVANDVDYLLTTYGEYPVDRRFLATKKVYRSRSREAALAFLKTQVVTEPLFYIEVETPDGVFGIDEGQRIFDETGHFIEAENAAADAS